MIAFFRSIVNERPKLFIVVYDMTLHTFSRPHPAAVEKQVAAQPWWYSPKHRVQRLLKPTGDKVTFIARVELFHSEIRDDVAIEYLLVMGHHFSFGAPSRLGRDFFNPKTDDLVQKFGEPDGTIAQAMIDRYIKRGFVQAL